MAKRARCEEAFSPVICAQTASREQRANWPQQTIEDTECQGNRYLTEFDEATIRKKSGKADFDTSSPHDYTQIVLAGACFCALVFHSLSYHLSYRRFALCSLSRRFTFEHPPFAMTSREKVRKWKEDFVQYGFTKTIIEGLDRPQCVFCNAIFSNSNLKPSKLGEHL